MRFFPPLKMKGREMKEGHRSIDVFVSLFKRCENFRPC